MKKIFAFTMLALMLVCFVITPVVAIAEATEIESPAIASEADGISADIEVPTEPFTWQYLATITGAAAFTLLVVQFFKVPLDKVWKIPTRLLAYIIAFATMLIATGFTAGLDAQTVMLAAANAFIAALASYGAYELTFSKLNK